MYSNKKIDEKFIEYLSESRISLTELMVSNIPDLTPLRLDSMSISFIYGIFLSRWKEFKIGITETRSRKYTFRDYISNYIPEMMWGNPRYGLFLIDSLNDFLTILEKNTVLEKNIRNQFSDLLNFNRFNEINETVITRLYESINSITIDVQGNFVLNYKVLDYESYYTPYDVCSFIIDKVWDKSSKNWEQNVLDPTAGSGNLVISYLIKIREEFSDKEVSRVIRSHLKCVDIDADALNVLSIALWFMGSLKDKYITVNQCIVNANIFSIKKLVYSGKVSKNKVHVVFSNPPYKTWRKKISTLKSQVSGVPYQVERAVEQEIINEQTMMLHVYIYQYMYTFTQGDSVIGFLIPSKIATSPKTEKVRNKLISKSSHLDFYNFDVIPSSLFDQDQFDMRYDILNDAIKKRTRITQRSSIVISKQKSNILARCQVSSTRMVRWKSEERPWLFENIKSVSVPRKLIDTLKLVPNVYTTDETILLSKINKCNPKVGDFLTDKEIPSVGRMRVPSFARYFIYASFGTNKKVNVSSFFLYPISIEAKKILYTYLNSGLFYWYWRKNTDGFQFSKTLLKTYPVPPVSAKEFHSVNKLVDELLGAEKECTNDDLNKGKFNNNFNKRYDLIEKLDKLYLTCIDSDYYPNFRYLPTLKRAKSNSLFLGEVPNLPYKSYPF